MCDGHYHNLKEIYRIDVGWREYHVVEWCKDCGAVTVTCETDNRKMHRVVPMEFPQLLLDVMHGKYVKAKKGGG